MKSNKGMLVSVGIPAYNRPERLKIAIESIQKQDHENLEIIISDDHSPLAEINQICREFCRADKRIRYITQPKNIGPEFNFRYVLNKSSGVYFMWAADDDERESSCISQYLENIGDAGGVFSTYAIRDYKNCIDKLIEPPILSGLKNDKTEIYKFITKPCPSMIYGMYKKEVAQYALPEKLFDFWDFYFALTVIEKFGIRTFSSKPLYFAGTDGQYKLNPFDKVSFKSRSYFLKTLPLIMRAGYPALMRHIKFLQWVRMLNYRILHDNGRI